MTSRFILALLDMLRLRSGPQYMPEGWLLAATLSFAYIAQGFIADQALGETDGAPRSLLAIGVQFGIVAVLLNIRKFQIRLPQTLAALAGTGLFFGLLSLLILTRIDSGKPQPDLALLYLGLFGWSLAVDAHPMLRCSSLIWTSQTALLAPCLGPFGPATQRPGKC